MQQLHRSRVLPSNAAAKGFFAGRRASAREGGRGEERAREGGAAKSVRGTTRGSQDFIAQAQAPSARGWLLRVEVFSSRGVHARSKNSNTRTLPAAGAQSGSRERVLRTRRVVLPGRSRLLVARHCPWAASQQRAPGSSQQHASDASKVAADARSAAAPPHRHRRAYNERTRFDVVWCMLVLGSVDVSQTQHAITRAGT